MSSSVSENNEWETAANRRLRYYSVPLLFRDHRGDFNPGTAVLVDLWGTKIAFTAGHCIEMFDTYEVVMTTPDVGGGARLIPLGRPVVSADIRGSKPSVDAGWFLVPEKTAEIFQARDKAFVGPDKIQLVEDGSFPEQVTHFAISGWPLDLIRFDGRSLDIVQKLFVCQMAQEPVEVDHVDGRTDPSPSSLYYKLALPNQGRFWPGREPDPAGVLPRLAGMSGSGLWGWSDADGEPNDVEVRLLGNLCHHSEASIEIKGDERMQMAASRVQATLQSVAENLPELAGRITETWGL